MNKKIIRCGMAVVCLIAYGIVSASDIAWQTVKEQEKKAAETLIALLNGDTASTATSSLNNKRTYDQVQNNTIEEDDTSTVRKIILPETGIERMVEGDEDQEEDESLDGAESQEEKEDEDRGLEFLNEMVIKLTSNQCKYPNCGKIFPEGAELIEKGLVSKKEQKALEEHVIEHMTGRGVNRICKWCGKFATRSNNLKEHTRIHTGERPYKCQVCEKTFTAPSNFKNHVRRHTGERPFKCEFAGCKKKFIRLHNLKKHMKSHSKNIIGANLVEVVENSQSLVVSLINLEEQEKLASSLNNKRTYDQVQNNTIDEEGDAFLACKKVLPVTDIEQAVENVEKEDEVLEIDGQNIEEEKDYKLLSNRCQYRQCEKIFPEGERLIEKKEVSDEVKRLLKKHIYNEHIKKGTPDYKCCYCGKIFASQQLKSSHILTHTGEKHFKCRYCDMLFTHLSPCINHETRHTVEKYFKCDICSKAFARNDVLKVHIEKEHFVEQINREMSHNKEELDRVKQPTEKQVQSGSKVSLEELLRRDHSSMFDEIDKIRATEQTNKKVSHDREKLEENE